MSTNVEIIKSLAKLWGIDVSDKSKEDLICAIQIKEGFEPCFATKTNCEEYGCCWRSDCLNVVTIPRDQRTGLSFFKVV